MKKLKNYNSTEGLGLKDFMLFKEVAEKFDSGNYVEARDLALDVRKADQVDSLLRVASLQGRLDVLAELVPMSDELGAQLLDASLNQRPDVLRGLLDLNCCFANDSVARATANGTEEHMELLIRKGYPIEEQIEYSDEFGAKAQISAVALAIQYGEDEKLKMLTKFGARISDEDVGHAKFSATRNLAKSIKDVQDEMARLEDVVAVGEVKSAKKKTGHKL